LLFCRIQRKYGSKTWSIQLSLSPGIHHYRFFVRNLHNDKIFWEGCSRKVIIREQAKLNLQAFWQNEMESSQEKLSILQSTTSGFSQPERISEKEEQIIEKCFVWWEELECKF
jgi:hypothetical protein